MTFPLRPIRLILLIIALVSSLQEAKADLFFSPTAKLGWVSMSSTNDTFQKRSMLRFAGDGIVGVTFAQRYLLGAHVEYSAFGQWAKPDALGGTNLEGKSLHAGIAGGLVFSNWQLIGTFDPIGTYSLEQKSVSGSAVTYAKAKSLSVALRYHFFQIPWVGVEYVSTSYAETKFADAVNVSFGGVKISGFSLTMGMSF